MNKEGEKLKEKVLNEAKSELKKIENLRKVKQAEEERKKKDAEKAAKMKAEGRVPEDEEGEGGWTRGTVKQPVRTEAEDGAGFRKGPAR